MQGETNRVIWMDLTPLTSYLGGLTAQRMLLSRGPGVGAFEAPNTIFRFAQNMYLSPSPPDLEALFSRQLSVNHMSLKRIRFLLS